MARGQANLINNKPRRQTQGKRPGGIEKRSQRLVRKIAPVLPKAVTPPKSTRKSSPNLRESTEKLDRKRKRSPEAEELTSHVLGETIDKRARISSPDKATRSKEGASDLNIENYPPIEYWRKTGNWPKNFFESDPNMSQRLTKKRSSSSMSYSQGVKEGHYPPAHTPTYEKQVLEPAGIFMDYQLGEAAISDGCKQLCTTLANATYEPPKGSLFEGDLFWKVLNAVRSRNEARVVRDISPLLIPSAELLCMHGVVGLKDLIEEIQADWTKCVPLAGPLPRPDFTVGLQSSAFTEDEVTKLRYHSAPEKATLFTAGLYFPFLICEVKCGENGLNIADRQNARSASTAVHAILQLYRTVSQAEQLHRKVLVFSVSHDHHMVKIYGHYALVGKEKSTFHRYLVGSFDISVYDDKSRWAPYNFVRKIYDHFAPIHLKRIQSAIAQLGEPLSESFMSITHSENDSELPDSRETPSAPASQDFIRPTLPPKKKRQNKDTEIVTLQQELERQREEAKQREDQLGEELVREKEESKQRHTELMEFLKEQKEQNKKLIDMLSKR